MARERERTQRSFLEELPELLAERGLTRHALALRAGVDPSHLSRAARGKDYKSLSPALVRRLGEALGLPVGYFPEERLAAVTDAIKADRELLDDIYARISRRPPRRSRPR